MNLIRYLRSVWRNGDSVSVLDDDINESDEEMVDEDESEENSNSSLSGLHAKFVVVEHQRSRASWTLGSANLTAGAFNGTQR